VNTAELISANIRVGILPVRTASENLRLSLACRVQTRKMKRTAKARQQSLWQARLFSCCVIWNGLDKLRDPFLPGK